jgi:hypothetical protein
LVEGTAPLDILDDMPSTNVFYLTQFLVNF